MATTQTLSHKEPASPPDQGFIVHLHHPSPELIELGNLTLIGRGSDCRIRTDDPFVSQRHARIERVRNRFLLRDLRSRNGTYVNGALVQEATLKPLDRITVGNTQFMFNHFRELKDITLYRTSKSQIWQERLKMLPNIAESDLPLLITGPSGAGKEGLAQEVHRLSQRARSPLITVNCSALSESIIESELFGHIKGSFTGAHADRQGAFLSANRGTLFLDEIGDLPLHVQPKILRALENQEIRPVGADHNIKVDVRIIAATHKPLLHLVQNEKFRMDLYYRLNVIPLNVPPLKDRVEDFDDLLLHFAKTYRVRFSFESIQRLKTEPWHGNIRELKNFVARAGAVMPGHTIDCQDLSHLIDNKMYSESVDAVGTRPSLLDEIEKKLIIESLVNHRGNQRKAAESIGMAKSTFHDRTRYYGINPKLFR